MKLRSFLLTLLFLIGLGQCRATTPSPTYYGLAGSIVGPDGTPFNGTLSIEISRPTAVDICTDPVSIIAQQKANFKVTNGSIVGGSSAQFLTNACMTPSIPYYATMFDSTNRQVYADNWFLPVLDVANIDVGTLQDAAIAAAGQASSTATPIIVAIPTAIVGAPAGQQTITQPGSTALVINNLTVTGTFALTGTASISSLTVTTLDAATVNATTLNSVNEALTGTLNLASGNGIIGPSILPTGSCSTAGLWLVSNAGNIGYCDGSTQIVFSTGNLGDWTNSGIANGDIPEWNSTTHKWTPATAPSGSFSAGGDLSGSSTSQQVVGIQGVSLPTLATGYPNYTGSIWQYTVLATGTLSDWTNSGIANGDVPSWDSGTSKWTPVANPAGAVPQSITITPLFGAGTSPTVTCMTVCNSFHGDIRIFPGSGLSNGDWVKVSWTNALSSAADPVIIPVSPNINGWPNWFIDGPNTNTTQFIVGISGSLGNIEFKYIVQPQQ